MATQPYMLSKYHLNSTLTVMSIVYLFSQYPSWQYQQGTVWQDPHVASHEQEQLQYLLWL